MMKKFETNKTLAPLTTFGIGGPASFFIEVRTVDEMQSAIDECRKQNLRYLVLGKGSNSLFDDRGFDGVVILNKIDFFENPAPGMYHVGSGFSFSLLGTKTARDGCTGLEFASGIPGTVGGAVFMNAGANGRETCDSLVSVDHIDGKGKLRIIDKSDLTFNYRTSSFQNIPGAIVGATFQLKQADDARDKQIEIITYRKETQPYGKKSAGCVFRNPEDTAAGALIEKCGLKGFSFGGAEVSSLHANFVVNTGNASAKDILSLIDIVKHRVKQVTGNDLECEVRYIPYQPEDS